MGKSVPGGVIQTTVSGERQGVGGREEAKGRDKQGWGRGGDGTGQPGGAGLAVAHVCVEA